MTTLEEYETVDLFSSWDAKTQPIITLYNLKKWFPVSQQSVLFSRVVANIKAVDGVNLFLNKGETLGLVGESGCGKSTTARVTVKLEEPTEGSVYFKGIDIFQPMTREEELAVKIKDAPDIEFFVSIPYLMDASLDKLSFGFLEKEGLLYFVGERYELCMGAAG